MAVALAGVWFWLNRPHLIRWSDYRFAVI